MSVRVRISLVGSNEKYAFRSNQAIAINNGLFRYDHMVEAAIKDAFAKFTEQEYQDLKNVMEGVLYPDGDLLKTIEERLSGFDISFSRKQAVREVLGKLTYVELCAILSLMEGVVKPPAL